MEEFWPLQIRPIRSAVPCNGIYIHCHQKMSGAKIRVELSAARDLGGLGASDSVHVRVSSSFLHTTDIEGYPKPLYQKKT